MSGFISVSGNEYPVGIAAGPDGSRVFVTGYTDGGSASIDWATAGYDAATGKQDQAVARLNEGLKVNPKDLGALMVLGAVYKETGDLGKAQQPGTEGCLERHDC